MKKFALLLLVLIIALGLLLHGCSKKTPPPPATDPATTSDDPTSQVDTLPAELPEPAPAAAPILVGYVTKDAVNVRQAASTTSSSVGKVSRGDMLLILKSGTTAGTNGGDWYEVRYNGKNAYIHADYLQSQEMTEDAVISVGTVVNVDSVLNIRSEPNSQSQRLGRANKSDKFVVLDQNMGDGSWSKIEYAGSEAYVKSDYLNVVQQMVVNMLLP